MHILVFIKQVPDVEKLGISKSRGEMFEAAKRIMNPSDRVALELAIRLRQTGDGNISAVTLGEEQAVEVLREALAMGADQAYLLSDPTFVHRDVLGNVVILAAAAKKIGKYDLILCGSQSPVGNTGQTGPRLAQALNLPQASFVRSLQVKGTSVIAERLLDGKTVEKELPLPALLIVHPEATQPRMPNAFMIMKAFKKEINRWGQSDLGLESLPEPVVKVRRTFLPESV